MMIETATAVRFFASAFPHYRHAWSSEEVNGVHVTTSRTSWSKFPRINGGSLIRKNRIRASSEKLSDSSNSGGKLQYHPFEEIADLTSDNSGDAMLTPQETARTIVEVNSKATLVLTDLAGDDFHENIIWPDLPYVTDEYGNIYFQVKNDEDIMRTLTSENNFVQVIIGLDTTEMLDEMELLGASDIDFGIEEIDDEDSDIEDDEDGDDDEDDEDYDEDLVAVIDDEDEDDDNDESLGDWAKLDTMQSSHPMYFAKKISQVASDDPIDWMEQPPAGLAIQGIIRPAFIEEHSDIQRHMSGHPLRHADIDETVKNINGKLENGEQINGQKLSAMPEDISKWEEESGKDKALANGASFYKLEMIKIQMISSHGYQTLVEEEDYRKAQPDAVAHSAGNIISRLNAGGEKITQALKSLCWRCKGLQVEEVAVIGVDTLGIDLRVCCGTQIETLRLSFNSRATSEYSAERQLNDLLFPRIPQRAPQKKKTRKNEL